MVQEQTLPLWCGDPETLKPDSHVAFRAHFTLTRPETVEVRLLGASWFSAWLGELRVGEGPARFPLSAPEYQTHVYGLGPGEEVLSIHAHHFGVPTRLLENPPPFVWAEVWVRGERVPLRWRCLPLPGYARTGRRLNGQLGWSEWCDTRLQPNNWQRLAFDDSRWQEPVVQRFPLKTPHALGAATALMVRQPMNRIATGTLTESFGYESDNPQARFFLRELTPSAPPQGVWRRYDLGRIRLARPRIVLDLPPGAIVEFAASEALTHGRVAPWVTLSASDSCFLDHFVARGGVQEFCPLQPKGGRYWEVHVLAPPDKVRFIREDALERTYFGTAVGNLATGDATLDRIWQVGVETLRACSEDAIVDTPTRERGQWAGDVVSVGLDIAGVVFDDLRIFRRGLVQCAQSARADGLVSGMVPGKDIYLSTYAAQWVSACWHYFERTGDDDLLDQLFDAAERNLAAFEAQRGPEGVRTNLAWAFVDWGYVPNPGPADVGMNLHHLQALTDMVRWCRYVGQEAKATRYEALADASRRSIQRYFEHEASWERRGFQRTALALRQGFFTGGDERAAVAALKAHLLRCFPNDPSAPRLSDPSAANPRLITPYFAHFAFPPLIERGELPFVLSQYKKCWGWALTIEDGTWLEVFDPRWSHCHQWAGCPTWQLSEALLGLRPCFDQGKNHFRFVAQTGGLKRVQGTVPLAGGRVRVQREGSRYTLLATVPLTLHLGDAVVRVERSWQTTLREGK